MAARLAGKVAVVTGAGRGIGAAYALALAAEGAEVVVNDVLAPEAGAVAEQVAAAGGEALADTSDVTDFAAAGELVKAAETAFGPVDILVANAGIMRPNLLHEMDPQDWYATFAVHVHGTFNCYRRLAPAMMQRRSGSIITTGSGSGEGETAGIYRGAPRFPGLSAYRSAKAALAEFTRYAAAELRPYGVNVNSVMPGATATAMQAAFYASMEAQGIVVAPEQGWPVAVPPESVPPLGVFLCSDAGRDITGQAFHLGGTTISVASVPKALTTLTTTGARWTVDEIEDRVPAALAELGLRPPPPTG